MFNLRVKITGNAPAVLEAIEAVQADKRGLLTVLGRAASNELQQHFQRLDIKHPNKMGGKRSHFWLRVRSAVETPRLNGGESITISINHPLISHKVTGGDIRPRNHKWLTIPMVKDAYDMTAEDWEEASGKKLEFIPKNNETAFLAEVRFFDKPRPKGSKKWGVTKAKEVVRMVFVLKKHVHQKPMTDALPSKIRWKEVLGDTAQEYMQLIISEKSQS